MKKVLCSVAVCASLLVLSGMALAADSINAIQTYTSAGTPNPTPPIGSVVTVEGTLYLVKGTFNTGAHYIQGSDGGMQVYYSTAALGVVGDSISVTGTIKAYSGELELDPISSFTVLSHPGEPEPIVKTVSQIITNVPPPAVYDYENVGNFTRVTATIATAPTSTTPGVDKSFKMYSGTDTLLVFISKNTGIDVTGVAVGELYQISGPIVKYNALAELKPRFQSDLVENPAQPAPVIANDSTSNWHPLSTDAITISADITSATGTITGATLYYRNSAGDSLGAFTSVAMTAGTVPSYHASIPTPHTLRQVDYYLEATDSFGQTTKLPTSAPAGFRSLAIGFTKIYNVQYAHPDSTKQSSALNNMVVNIQGIVTYGSGEVGSPTKFMLEDVKGGPFSGVLVYESTGTYGTVMRGDEVKIGGRVSEYYGLTEMNPYNGAAVTLASYGNELPLPLRVHTRTLADRTRTDGDGIMGEAYEGVRVQTYVSVVVDSLGSGRFIISDTGARADSVLVHPFLNMISYTPIIPDWMKIEAWMDDAGSMYRLRPASDADILASDVTGIGDTTPQLLPAGGFVGVSPNPFNPKTKIEFALTRPNLVQLNVYNLRGQLVRQLVNGRLEPGSHEAFWDGTDDQGGRAGSGTYFARLRLGTEVLQVQKLALVK